MKSEVSFKIDNFEGPLDLLIFLIKRKKMSISELSLVKVANQFVDYINNSEKIDLNESSEYLLIATQLLEIKTKYLLNVESGKKAESNLSDSKDLLKRLIEYQRYQKISEQMFELFKKNTLLEKETNDFNDFVVDNIEKNYSLVSNGVLDIKKAIERININLTNRKLTNTTLKVKRISVEQRRKQLEEHFKENSNSNFIDLVSSNSSKYMIAITLLCLLEMANSKLLTISQGQDGTIFIESLIS